MKTNVSHPRLILLALAWLGLGTVVQAQPAPMTAPTSTDATVQYGTPFTPTFIGGSGGTTYIVCVPGYTNWQTDSWTPPAPGTYQFWVGLLPSPGFQGNIDDPLIGNLECDGTQYTLTVLPAPMTAPASTDATISAGTPWTPNFFGGSGGDTYIFAVLDYTGWQSGSWTPPGPGTYRFWVGLLPAFGYQGNLDDPTVGNFESDGFEYVLTVE